MTEKTKQLIKFHAYKAAFHREKVKTHKLAIARLRGKLPTHQTGQGWRRGWAPPNRLAEAMAADAIKRHAVDPPKGAIR